MPGVCPRHPFAQRSCVPHRRSTALLGAQTCPRWGHLWLADARTEARLQKNEVLVWVARKTSPQMGKSPELEAMHSLPLMAGFTAETDVFGL